MGLSTALLYDNLQIDSYSYLFDMVAGRFVFGKTFDLFVYGLLLYAVAIENRFRVPDKSLIR
jgi:hypothetical protein